MERLLTNQQEQPQKVNRLLIPTQRPKTMSRIEVSSAPFGMPHWEPPIDRQQVRRTEKQMRELLKPLPVSPLRRYRGLLDKWPSPTSTSKWPSKVPPGAKFGATILGA